MRYIEFLALACFVVGAILAAIGSPTTGFYLFAVGVALAVLRAAAAEAEKRSSQNTET